MSDGVLFFLLLKLGFHIILCFYFKNNDSYKNLSLLKQKKNAFIKKMFWLNKHIFICNSNCHNPIFE
jgi:hypothetical protein